MARPDLEECSDHYVERIAHIIGESSAAARALAERDARRESGEDVTVFVDRGGRWVVGPRLTPSPASK